MAAYLLANNRILDQEDFTNTSRKYHKLLPRTVEGFSPVAVQRGLLKETTRPSGLW